MASRAKGMHRNGSNWECMPETFSDGNMSLMINVTPSSKTLSKRLDGSNISMRWGAGSKYCGVRELGLT